jgi:hypothetical protein
MLSFIPFKLIYVYCFFCYDGMKTECFSSDSISNLFSFKWQSNQKLQGLREELNAIVPYLEEMRKKKVERWDQFVDVIEQIKKVASEIRPADFVPFRIPVDQSDLSLRKLEELTKELQSLQKEKVSITCSNPLYLSNEYYSPCLLFSFNTHTSL